MKIIELYTKLANKKIIPRYIKVNDRKYEFDESDNEYYPREENDSDTLLERISRGNVLGWLNVEVEELDTLEEEKKIPEKLDIRQEKNIKNNWKWKVYGKEHSYNISTPQKIIADKVNEICDYLKSKGE